MRTRYRSALMTVVAGLTACGGSPVAPPDTPLGQGQLKVVKLRGTVWEAGSGHPLPGAEVSWYTCTIDGKECTPHVFSDSLGHYAMAHEYVVRACEPGRPETYFLPAGGGIAASVQGYGPSGTYVHPSVVTDYCGEVIVEFDLFLARFP